MLRTAGRERTDGKEACILRAGVGRPSWRSSKLAKPGRASSGRWSSSSPLALKGGGGGGPCVSGSVASLPHPLPRSGGWLVAHRTSSTVATMHRVAPSRSGKHSKFTWTWGVVHVDLPGLLRSLSLCFFSFFSLLITSSRARVKFVV